MAAEDLEDWEDISGDGGILKKGLVEGWGHPPVEGVSVKVHYTGTLLDGTKFDSSVDRGEPFKFDLGKGKVIKGWDEGVKTMIEGEKCILRCRSDYAYGDRGAGAKIPAGATLDFEVELLDQFTDFIDEEMKPWSGIQEKLIRREFETHLNPKTEATIMFSFGVYTDRDLNNDSEVCSQEISDFIIDDESSFAEWPRFFHTLLKTVHEKETKVFQINATQYPPVEMWGVPENTDPYYMTIQVQSFSNPKELWQYSSAEKVELAQTKKAEGNDAFKAKDFQGAFKCYQKGIGALKDVVGEDGDSSEEDDAAKVETDIVTLWVTLNSNLAMAALKLAKESEGIEACTAALKKDPNHLKSIFRRCQCYINTGNLEQAVEDCARGQELDAQYFVKLDSFIKKKQRAYKKKQKKLAKAMFG